MTVSPGASHKQLTINAAKVGDVSLMLRVRVDRNADESVFVNFDARLFDENDVVASTSTNFSLEKASSHKATAKLVDYHAGDPDTGNIELTVTNDDA